METNYSTYKIRWLPYILYSISFLRMLLWNGNLQINQGFILVFDSESQAREFCQSYCRNAGNGEKVLLKTHLKNAYNNDCIVFASITKQKEEDMQEFLESANCFAVLMSGGVLTNAFREDHYLFRVNSRDVDYVGCSQFSEAVQKLKEYIINNVSVVQKVIEQVETSVAYASYKKKVQHKPLLKLLLAVGEVQRSYIRDVENENQADLFWNTYVQESVRRICAIQDFADGLEIRQLLTEAFFEQIDSGSILMIKPIHNIDMNVLNLMKNHKAIVFDEEYYYLTEEMLKNICSSMTGEYSWLELKHQMAESGVIRKWDSGFTAKKSFVYEGSSIRLRVMMIHKEIVFASGDGSSLEDYFEEKAKVGGRT